MAEYYVAWAGEDNPGCGVFTRDKREPVLFKVWRVNQREGSEAVTEAMTKDEANEMLRKIKLLDPPAQKELDLKWR
jgi:hypothetical protein